jgi:RNA recognition motif-containing protein
MRKAGDVVHVEVMSEPDGKSKGYGICEFANDRDAQTAIDTLNETDLKGRTIYVREDTKDPPQQFGGRREERGRDDRGRDDRSRDDRSRDGSRDDRGTNNSIYLWNLSYDTTWQRLEDHCRRTGNVDSATILTGQDGRSIGCGVVVYQDSRGASRALRELDCSALDGREIRIREDRGHNDSRRSEDDDDRRHNARRGADSSNNSCQLFVGNLSFKTTWQELKDHFRKCGHVDHVEVMEGPDGRKRGFGTVRFSNIRDAEKAIDEMDGVELDGRSLEVRFDKRL